MKTLALLCLVAVAALDVKAMDGYTVAKVGRWSRDVNIPDNDFGFSWIGEAIDTPGKIVRATIVNDAVSVIDTLYNASYAKFPVINLTGTMVAMYRYEARLEGGALVDLDKPRHISVINMDGANLRDLVTFTKEEVQGGAEMRILLDWTAGDWLYYTRPSESYPDGPREIWRVHPSDPSTNALVYRYDCSDWLNLVRWDITADGTRSTLQGTWTQAYTNVVSDFPPTQDPTPFDGYYANVCCCNIACSPTGLFLGRFIDGPHTSVVWSRWDPDDVTSVNGQEWVSVAMMDEWAGEDVGGYMGMLRWSSNSDKWYTVMPGSCRAAHTCGGNQILVNHMDQKALKVTHFPNTNSGIVVSATAGDSWVKPPDGMNGRIQDSLGNWIEVDGNVKAAKGIRPAPHNSAPRVSVQRLLRPDEHTVALGGGTGDVQRVELLDAAGRCLFTEQTTQSSITVPRMCIGQGVLMVRVVQE